jgi:hypothetical protein
MQAGQGGHIMSLHILRQREADLHLVDEDGATAWLWYAWHSGGMLGARQAWPADQTSWACAVQGGTEGPRGSAPIPARRGPHAAGRSRPRGNDVCMPWVPRGGVSGSLSQMGGGGGCTQRAALGGVFGTGERGRVSIGSRGGPDTQGSDEPYGRGLRPGERTQAGSHPAEVPRGMPMLRHEWSHRLANAYAMSRGH